MSRIIAGSARGRTLKVPQRGTRPTSDKVREALFSRLQHWGVLEDARVLDLYAGSGALALEALSRGAATATLVEFSKPAAGICRENIKYLGFSDRATVANVRAERFVQAMDHGPWDLIFCDPPYDLSGAALSQVLKNLADGGTLAPEATIVVERAKRAEEPAWPTNWELSDTRNYGDTTVYLLVVSSVTLSHD